MYPGSRYLRQIAARVSGSRSNSGLGISNSSMDFSASDMDGNMLGGLTDQSLMSDDGDQLSYSGSLRVEPSILECGNGIVGGANISTSVVSPYRQVIVGGSNESIPRVREQLPKLDSTPYFW
ncbi:unnamed protein product [Trichobilharzia regenti]|nr:unnamed protein product [Trichobilharzia regenti]